MTSWPWTTRKPHESDLPPQRAAERVESYVYGNVLVLAAVAALSVADVASGQAALLVLGTAFSTFVAHLLAVTVGHRAHHTPEGDGAGHPVRHAIRDAVPIATSGLIPTAILALGWDGVLSAQASLWGAMGVSVVRFVLMGSVVSYLSGERSTWKNVLLGLALGAAGLVVAGVKFWLTH